MTADTKKDSAQAKSQGSSTSRKPWIKRTPVQVVLEQIDKQRQKVAEKEEELKQDRRELQKLEEARKVLEAK